MTRLHAIATLACLLGTSAALASEPTATTTPVFVAPTPALKTLPDPKCGTKSLADCTRERVASLRQLSGDLKRAAALDPGATPQTAADQQALASYNQWLNSRSTEASNLAAQGQRALAQADLQMSFNMQYLALQSKVQQESRRYTTLSNVMKTKHDTAKNSISNMR
jgi:hypothetical protein